MNIHTLVKPHITRRFSHTQTQNANKMRIARAEAFAHMYEAQFDKIRYAETQKYFPSALSKFESMIKEAAK